MGWWSCTIMGGDTPYDARDEMQEVSGITCDDLYPENDDDRISDEVIHNRIKMNVPAMIEVAEKDDDYYVSVKK